MGATKAKKLPDVDRETSEGCSVQHEVSLDEIDLREIAAELRRDIRTVRRVARGETIRGLLAMADIRRAIAKRVRS